MKGTMSGNSNRKFESVFRIDGKPILPPLVTTDMKAEFQKLRVKAKELEQQFADCRRKQRECEDKTLESENSDKAETVVPCNNAQCQRGRSFSRNLELDASFQTITNWLREDELNNNFNKLAKANSASVHERLKKLKQTETVAFDNHFKTVIYPTNNVIKYVPNEYTVVHMSNVSNQCWIIIDVSKLDKSKEKATRVKGITEQSKAKVPSICVCPPTPQTETVVLKSSTATGDNTTFLHIADTGQATDDDSSTDNNSSHLHSQNPAAVERRLILSSSQSDSSLVRSSSFTVPEPSPALRNHMLANNLECGSLDSLNKSSSNSANNVVECRRRSSIRDDSDSDATINNLQTARNGAVKKKQQAKKTFISTGNKLTDSVKNNLANVYSPGTKYRSPYTIAKKVTDPVLTARVNSQLDTVSRSPQAVNRNQLSSSATRDTVESKAKRVQKANTKQTLASTPSPPFKQQRRYPTGYNPMSARTATMTQKPSTYVDNKSLTARGPKPTTRDRYSQPDGIATPTTHGHPHHTRSRDLLSATENQLFTSIVKQEEERKRLLNALNAERNLLICNAKHKTVIVPDLASLTSSSPIPHSDADTNKTGEGITSLDSSYGDGITIQSALNKSPHRSFSGVANRSEVETLGDDIAIGRRHVAATTINAYARGFLVRRLFRTEHVKRIVATIRDTLLFVLRLHIETIENPADNNTPANIQLKVRLLQQLTSASRTLHMTLFDITVKERMEIIARDRIRLKTKLEALNSKR